MDPTLFLVALGAGIVSFISPCNAVMLPTFVSYISTEGKDTKHALFLGILYALGFSFTFAFLAIIFMLIPSFIQNRYYFNIIAGILIIGLALYIFFDRQLIKNKNSKTNDKNNQQHEINHKYTKINDEKNGEINGEIINSNENKNDTNNKATVKNNRENIEKPPLKERVHGYGGAFVLGFSVGSSWIPCVTPVFGTIVTIAAVQHEYFAGLWLMVMYGIGITLPFIILAAFIGNFNKRFLVKLIKYGAKIQRVFALLLLWVGIEILLSAFGIPGLVSYF